MLSNQIFFLELNNAQGHANFTSKQSSHKHQILMNANKS